MADILLSARTAFFIDTSAIISKNWVCKFINCYKQLKLKYIQKYNYQQVLCKDAKAISDWFWLVENTQVKYSISREDVYNLTKLAFK